MNKERISLKANLKLSMSVTADVPLSLSLGLVGKLIGGVILGVTLVIILNINYTPIPTHPGNPDAYEQRISGNVHSPSIFFSCP